MAVMMRKWVTVKGGLATEIRAGDKNGFAA
jgi:hypothetical protein